MAKFRPLTLCAALVLAWGAHAQSLSLTPPAPAAAKPAKGGKPEAKAADAKGDKKKK